MPHFQLGAQIVEAEQWFKGKAIKGVRKVAATNVDCSKTRGIIFEKPERYVAETSLGACDLAEGDWIVTCPTGLTVHFKSQIFDLVAVPVRLGAHGQLMSQQNRCTDKKQGLPSILSRLFGKEGS